MKTVETNPQQKTKKRMTYSKKKYNPFLVVQQFLKKNTQFIGKRTFATIFLLLTVFANLKAQDILTKKDGTQIKVIIKEVTKNTIKYVDFNDPNGVVFTIDKVLLSDVKFAYGKDLDVKNPEENPLYFSEDKVNNILLNFSAFGGNTLGIAYEKAFKLGKSYMIEAKIYGIGIKPERETNRSGFGLSFSYRLKTGSLFNKDTYRPDHILHGAYFAPVIGFSSGKNTNNDLYYSYNNNDLPNTVSHNLVHFGLEYGKQWVLQRKVTIDYSFGFHYYLGKDGSSSSNNDTTYYYEYSPIQLGNMVGSNQKLFSFNLRVGFLTGEKQRIKK